MNSDKNQCKNYSIGKATWCLTILAVLFALSIGAQESATKPDRWTNSLGMVFVRVPSSHVWFCIWETRIQDYGVFVREGHWGRLWPERPGFDQQPSHPVVNVSWEDAKDFCIWLTQKEKALGQLSQEQVYRLPTDLEWSQAVGLPKESGKTAEKRSCEFPNQCPWGIVKSEVEKGNRRPMPVAPPGAGNFSGTSDGFKFTAPVGTFKPNGLGIYDLGGNVWEWVIDYADDGRRHVLRGGSWFNYPMASSVRDFTLPDNMVGNVGFRCVLTDAPSNP